MDERVIVIRGPGADLAVVDHARQVFNHYGVPFAEVASAGMR